MQALITGMHGFAGRELANLILRETDWRIAGVSRSPQPLPSNTRLSWIQLDLTDRDGVLRMIGELRPDAIVHLAAQTHVPTSWEAPWETYEQNLHPQLNLFHAVMAAQIKPRILVVTSNEVYGAPHSHELPFRESQPFRPNNPYAVSKAAQDLMARQYHISHNMDVCVARPFNHVGPGQATRFVIPGFAQQLAEIEAGLREPVMRLGNMAAQRDFTDVRDVARAYLALLKSGKPGNAYNVCSGQPRSIQMILDTMLTLTRLQVEQVTDPSKFRPIDTPVSFGDHTLLTQASGWQPAIPFETTIADVLEEARARVAIR